MNTQPHPLVTGQLLREMGHTAIGLVIGADTVSTHIMWIRCDGVIWVWSPGYHVAAWPVDTSPTKIERGSLYVIA